MSYYTPDDIYKRRRAKDPFLKWILICWLVPFGMIYHAITRRTWDVIIYHLSGTIVTNSILIGFIVGIAQPGSPASRTEFLDTFFIAQLLFGWAFIWMALSSERYVTGAALTPKETINKSHGFMGLQVGDNAKSGRSTNQSSYPGRAIQSPKPQWKNTSTDKPPAKPVTAKPSQQKEKGEFEFDKSERMLALKGGRPAESNEKSSQTEEASLPTAKLQELKTAFDQGLIDDEEYSALKKQLLGL